MKQMELTQEQIDACRREEGRVFGLCSPKVQKALRDAGWQNREYHSSGRWKADIDDIIGDSMAFRLKPDVVVAKPWELTQEMIDLCRTEDDLPFSRKSEAVKEILRRVGWERRKYGWISWVNDVNDILFDSMFYKLQ